MTARDVVRVVSVACVLAVAITACGASARETRAPRWTSADDHEDGVAAPTTETTEIAPPSTALARRESRTIRIEHAEPGEGVGTSDATSARPTRRVGRGRRVDVAFREADLANALRFLASAGGLNLVLAEGLSGTVTVELRRVRALDAIVALAEAHGATVEMREGIVVVRGAR